MEKSIDNYLVSKLEEGRNLCIVLLSHNAYWPQIQKLGNHFENCNVVVFGDSTSYLELATFEKRKQIENGDLFVFYSSDLYDEEELLELKDMVSKISTSKNKRVSIGYSFFIPTEQRAHGSQLGQIKIISFKNGEEACEETAPTPSFSAYDLVELTLAAADKYDIVKQQRLEKKL